MKTRCLVSLMVVATFVLFSQPAIADDLADLKATHQRLWKAWNAGDLKTVFEIWQDGAIWLPTNRAFPVVSSSARGMKIFTRFLETHTYRSDWYKPDFRVIGNTGLVWGLRTTRIVCKTKGIGKRSNFKSTMVYVKSEGKWVAVMSHDTLLSEADVF